MERFLKLLQQDISTQWAAKSIVCSQSAEAKIWSINGRVIQRKHAGWPRKMPKHQNRKLKAIGQRIENSLQKNEKQMSRNRSQCFWPNCKKPADGNGIYIQRIQQILLKISEVLQRQNVPLLDINEHSPSVWFHHFCQRLYRVYLSFYISLRLRQ